MTMKPKARKYRIRRRASSEQHAGSSPEAAAPGPIDIAKTTSPAAPEGAAVESTTGAIAGPPEGAAADLEAIRGEELTARQLRMARRMAQKQGLSPSSDLDAVRLLRANGIDPFKRTNTLRLVVSSAEESAPEANTAASLPQTRPQPAPPDLPRPPSPAQRRSEEVARIQRDIARRRRRKLGLLFLRLAVFVGLPTLIAADYFYRIATPMYATKSEFVIQQAEGGSGGSGLGGLLPAQFNTNQDSIAVQSYLENRAAMLRLDEELGFKAHFQQDFIDPIQRLDDDASNEDAYKLYRKNVKLGYDPTEGVVKMEVIAANPLTSQMFAERLIEYAEERVDNLTRRKRDDQLSESRATLQKAMDDRRLAQESLVSLQQEASIVDPEARIAALRAQITQRELELQEKQLQLEALLDNRRPNASRVDGVRGDIVRLQDLLDTLRTRMNVAVEGEGSLAEITTRIKLAQADLEMQNLMLQSALQNLETAQLEANRQTRYLSRSVDPVAPDEATYPRAFEDTILSFLILSGLYLMISLTASVLREQVSN